MEQIKNAIQNGKTVLGIELGSTRIKAVLIDENNNPIRPAVTNGKTVWKTVFGHTVLRTFGQVFRQATKIWLTTLKINTTKNLQKSVQ